MLAGQGEVEQDSGNKILDLYLSLFCSHPYLEFFKFIVTNQFSFRLFNKYQSLTKQ